MLSKLEGEASNIIKRILQGDRELTREEKRCLICFVAMQNVRTPQRIQKIYDEITELAKKMLNNSGKIKETDEYRKQSFAYALETTFINVKQIITTGSKDYPKSPVQSFLVIKEQSWKLPLTYECLRRPTADKAINLLKQDPKFAVAFS